MMGDEGRSALLASSRGRCFCSLYPAMLSCSARRRGRGRLAGGGSSSGNSSGVVRSQFGWPWGLESSRCDG